jgi:hypothetical protein
VEGEDDEKIFQKFFNSATTWIETADGKNELLKIIGQLSRETKQVVGIRDADFSNLENEKSSADGLFFTDCHDIEMTILKEDEVRLNIFSEYGKVKEMRKIWDTIAENAVYMGYLHWYNFRTNSGYSLDGLFYKYDIAGIAREKQKILEIINAQSPHKKQELKEDAVKDFIALNSTTDICNLCNGHDAISLLMITLPVGERAVYTALRLSYQKSHFMRTRLYADLVSWQEKSGFTLF